VSKKVETAVDKKDKEEARRHFMEASEVISYGSLKGHHPQKYASRKISRLARLGKYGS